jgi:YD repeat-containing protein
VSVTTPDGAVVSTAYSGNQLTVTDQSGRQRRSVSDALGRLAQVTEDPTTGGLNYVTNYTSDVLGNLRKVEQGEQLRFFMYDSLSRLIRAKNPEQGNFTPDTGTNPDFPALTDATSGIGNSQWSWGYSYDANGNLIRRKDARNVVSTYVYDALNRNTSVTYTNDPAQTPAVVRRYDGAVNGLGRVWWSSTGETATELDEYDAAGRVREQHQSFLVGGIWSQPFSVQRTYNLAGAVTAETYPSGHSVTYNYDGAGRLGDHAGQPAFSGNLGDGVARTYSTGLSYSEFGGLRQEQFGTQIPLYHKLHYNVRGQLFDVRLSTNSLQANEWDWNRGALVNYYSTNYQWGGAAGADGSGPDNNGNLVRAETFVPGNDQIGTFSAYRETYAYDSLNRLKSAGEVWFSDWSGQTRASYTQSYDYDRYGNRTLNQLQTTGITHTPFELNPQANQEVAEPSNRLYAPGDVGRAPAQKWMRYDAAGNLVYDAYTGQGARVYDAERRMTAAEDSYQNWSSYTYDSDGRRVQRHTAQQETWQVYGIDGELLAEYVAWAAPFLATKEYGYRSGELLVTMSSGDPQRLRRFIQHLSDNALARDPTAAEWQQQTEALAQAGVQGQSPLLSKAREIARGLFQSSEYSARGRTDAQYVVDLYNTYLQRGPDSAGLAYWVNNTQVNGRMATLKAFEVSTELASLAATVYGTANGGDDERVEGFVRNFYYGVRQREPTSEELRQQVQRLKEAAAESQGQAVSAAQAMGRDLFQSTEYNSGRTNEEYVTALYEACWQRAPDGPGLSYWVSQVTVKGRAATLNGFRAIFSLANSA